MRAAGVHHVLQPGNHRQERERKHHQRDTELPPQGLAVANLERDKADGKRRQDSREQQLELERCMLPDRPKRAASQLELLCRK